MELIDFLPKFVLMLLNLLLKYDFRLQLMLLLLHLAPNQFCVSINILSRVRLLNQLVAKTVDFFLQSKDGSLLLVKVRVQGKVAIFHYFRHLNQLLKTLLRLLQNLL